MMSFKINDPSALLRPWRNLQQFSEELYAMFSKGGQPEAAPESATGRDSAEDSPGSRRPARSDDQQPLDTVRNARLETIRERSVAPEVSPRDSHYVRPRTPQAAQEEPSRPRQSPASEASRETGSAAPAPQRRTTYESTEIVSPRSTASDDSVYSKTRREIDHSDQGSRSEYAAQPAHRDRRIYESPDRQASDRKHAAEKVADVPVKASGQDVSVQSSLDIGDFVKWSPPGGGGSTVFLGQVVSGTGATYQVTLFPNGPTQDAGSTVTVTIPMIDPTDTIAPDTWINPIFQGADTDGNTIYFCQVPVWMA